MTAVYDEAGRQIAAEHSTGRRAERQYRTRQTDGVNAVAVSESTGVVWKWS